MATSFPLQPRKSSQTRAPFFGAQALRLASLFRLWHLTSLDAPTVAMIWMLAFAKAARVQLPLWAPAVLAFACWSFYVGDRLLDARRAYSTPSQMLPATVSRRELRKRFESLRARHHFHWRHRRIFAPLALAVALGAIGLLLRSMPLGARGRNTVLAAAALAYFGSVHSPWRLPTAKIGRRMPKELLVGILFTLACATPVWARNAAPQRMELLLPIFAFIALAWLNCHAIERWESLEVRGQVSGIFRLAASLAAVSLVAALTTALLDSPRQASLLLAASASAALLACLDGRRQRMEPVLLRAAADLVLLTPLALVAFGA